MEIARDRWKRLTITPSMGSEGEEGTCIADTLLTWNRNQQAVKVYCIAGLSAGNGVFDWDDENIAQGGVWMYYHVDNGVFYSH